MVQWTAPLGSSRRAVRCRSRGYKVVGAGACFWTASRNLGYCKSSRTIHPPTGIGTTSTTTTAINTFRGQFSRFHGIQVVPSCTMAGTPSGRHHKPRRKVKQNGEGKGFQLSKAETLVRAPSFPLSAFLWPARGSVSQWEVLPLILMVVGLFRWSAGLWGYSGEHRPRRYGRARLACRAWSSKYPTDINSCVCRI